MVRFIIILALLLCSCSQSSVEYVDFLKYRSSYTEGERLKEQSNYHEAINHYKDSDNSIDNFSAPKKMAECYMLLGEKKEALKMLSLAFRRGFPITSIDSELFKPIWQEVEEAYEEGSFKYYDAVDTLLKKKLEEMIRLDQTNRAQYESFRQEFGKIDSANIAELSEICAEKGWPGRKLLGYGNIPDPSILVIHSSEEDNLYFLDIAMKASLNNESSWFGTRAIMINLLWRFDHNGYDKLRHTYLTDRGDLDFEKSSFQLLSLVTSLNDNPTKKIILVAFEQSNNDLFSSIYVNRLTEIKEILIHYGLDSNRVSINTKLIPNPPDKLGDSYFGLLFH